MEAAYRERAEEEQEACTVVVWHCLGREVVLHQATELDFRVY
jgi:hypothetical protein